MSSHDAIYRARRENRLESQRPEVRPRRSLSGGRVGVDISRVSWAMKLISMVVLSAQPTLPDPIILAAEHDVSSFSYFQRKRSQHDPGRYRPSN